MDIRSSDVVEHAVAAPALGRTAVEELRGAVRGELLGPDDPAYESARRTWNALVDKRPALIARCAGAGDVVAALRLARERGLEVSVRGGGHSVDGKSVTDGGLMIDLSPMRSVRVDPEGRRAWVGGGCTWADVDRETQQFGLATTGGFVSHTGVGGLTLGGGEGNLSRLHGMSVDNLVSADVVTADGEFVVASEDRNSDLFWALRGAGANFGVVTSFEFRLHPVGPTVLSGDLFFAEKDGLAALRAFRDFAAEAPDSFSLSAGVGTASAAPFLPESEVGKTIVAVSFAYFGDPDEGLRLAAPLRSAARPLAELIDRVPYVALQTQSDESQRPGLRRYFTGHFLWELSDAALETLLARGAASADGELPLCSGGVLALRGAVARVPEDAMAYSHRDAACDFIASASWEDPAEDAQRMGDARRFFQAMTPFARGLYVNSLTFDDPAERIRDAYGPAKYERLVELKTKFDPANVFHLNHNIRPGPGAATR